MTEDTTKDFLEKDQQLIAYQDLVDMVTKFQDQLQSLDYRVTNKNFGSKFYQTKEVITSKARFIAGAADDVAIMDAQHPTYRLWIGTADPATAPFRVDKNGNATLSSVTITGYVPAGGSLADIGVGGITGTYIDSGAITTPKLAATAIDGMTITGALIRTSSSGGRVVLNDSTDALEVFDSSGVKRIVLDNDELTFYNASAADLGGIYADTTNLTIEANNGNFLLFKAAASYGMDFTVGTSQIMTVTAAGVTIVNGALLAGDATTDMGNSTQGFRHFYFEDVTSNPTTNGQMLYYNSGGSEGLRMRFGGANFQFDATAV